MRSIDANRMFLTTILAYLGVEVFVGFGVIVLGLSFDFVTLDLITEALFIIPAFIFLLNAQKYTGMDIAAQTAIRKPEPVIMLLSAVYLLLLMPATSLINMISMMFTENTIESMEEEITAMPVWLTVFLIGVLGPAVEEFVFRGVILQSYLRDRPGRFGPVFLSSLLFGLVHMNLNQALYAFFVGIALGMLCMITGSLIYPMVCHMLFNSIEAVMLYVVESDELNSLKGAAYYDALKESIALMMIVSLVFTALALCVLMCIRNICAKNRRQDMRGSVVQQSFPPAGHVVYRQQMPLQPGVRPRRTPDLPPFIQGTGHYPGMQQPGVPGYQGRTDHPYGSAALWEPEIVTPSVIVGMVICLMVIVLTEM
ncbi:MAG: CPBP family intramembrane metalloprotease [Lachnospiraceae bacterium]|nr:CPBP family intramembrane metalloprotease [Lachnospiraceae bacterium]